ncbi:MAG TPA: hypothetical protein VFI81_07580 [Rhodanobacteraceae bacterium]|nr:hypothetical protein [Rhodanobacteraceae bacterium]
MHGNNWILLIIAVILLANAVHGLITGRASLAAAPFKRSERPFLYWSAIVFSGIFGLGSLLALMYTLLH